MVAEGVALQVEEVGDTAVAAKRDVVAAVASERLADHRSHN